MTTNRLTPEQNAARTAMARDNVHLGYGQGQHGGWGLGMAVRKDYLQHGWIKRHTRSNGLAKIRPARFDC